MYKLMKVDHFIIALFSLSILMAGCDDQNENGPTTSTQKVEYSKEETAECSECDNKQYGQLRSSYKLIGKWKVNNLNRESLYDFEIYQNGDEYIGVRISKTLHFEQLSKDGDSFIIQDTEHGEFYRIDDQNNLKFFDQDPEWTRAGRSATKVF